MGKSAFHIDLEARTATCPQDHTVSGQPSGKEDGQDTWLFTFGRATCEACSLFERCVRSKKAGRTVRTRAYEAYLQAARLRSHAMLAGLSELHSGRFDRAWQASLLRAA